MTKNRTAHPRPPAVTAPPASTRPALLTAPRGLTQVQLDRLNEVLHPYRVRDLEGFPYIEGWDVRRSLTEIFGYAGWSLTLLQPTELVERGQVDTAESVRWTVTYRAMVRLTVRDQWGNELAHFDASDTHTVEGEPKLGVAHSNALKSAETDALKRAALNLGNQFGAPLYNGDHYARGQRFAVRGVLVPAVDDPTGEVKPLEPSEDQMAFGRELSDGSVREGMYAPERVGDDVMTFLADYDMLSTPEQIQAKLKEARSEKLKYADRYAGEFGGEHRTVEEALLLKGRRLAAEMEAKAKAFAADLEAPPSDDDLPPNVGTHACGCDAATVTANGAHLDGCSLPAPALNGVARP